MDHVLTFGYNIDSICAEDNDISDNHCGVLNLSVTVTQAAAHHEVYSHFLNSSTASMFSEASNLFSSLLNDVDILTHLFNEHWLSVLDQICPFKMRSVPF